MVWRGESERERRDGKAVGRIGEFGKFVETLWLSDDAGDLIGGWEILYPRY
jgi:hypothetical protein